MFKSKTIFISALDWGLGHATRCVPLIRELEKNNKIIIGITPLTKPIFDEEFPNHEQVNIVAYNIKYSSWLPLWFKLMLDSSRIRSVIKKEKGFLEKIISEKKVDIVISDSRFGLFSKKVHSVFITHQLFLRTPFARNFFQKKNQAYLLNFDQIWVPDFEDEKISLSGQLSHGKHFHKNVKYIGPQSRLQKIIPQKKYDYLLLLSGPEPQKEILKNKLLELVLQHPGVHFSLVSPGNKEIPAFKNLDVHFSPNTKQLSELIAQSEKIICRSGYSTLMDLNALEKKNITLIPTPGQTEQEYLAFLWKEKFGATIIKQQHLNQIKLK